MADIQPKNTDTIRVNTIKEKTASAGITLDNTIKVNAINEKTTNNGVQLQGIMGFRSDGTKRLYPLASDVDLGTSTAAEHIQVAYIKTIKSNGQALAVGTDSAHDFTLKTDALTRFKIGSGGTLEQDPTNGSSILMTKASTCVVPGTALTGISAAGSVITDATDLTAVFNNVTTVGANQGVQLWDAPLHSELIVRNASGTTVRVYPESGTSNIDGGAAGAYVNVEAAYMGTFRKVSATNWISIKHAVTAA